MDQGSSARQDAVLAPSFDTDIGDLVFIRLLRREDADEIAEVWRANRDFLAPWSPVRPDDFFELSNQRAAIESELSEYEAGRMVPFVICGQHGEIAGKLNLNGITKGALQSVAMGYWVREDMNGRGLATGAAKEAVGYAFDVLGLHRVQAETLLDNVASQRVLGRAGFQPYGVAPTYLKIAGRWRDHVLFNVFSEEDGRQQGGVS